MPNLYAGLAAGDAEQFTELLARPGLKIERIISTGQASPPGFWYDQPHTEWVLLLAGAASLSFEDEGAPRHLLPGDYLEIAPRRRHRVESTHPELATVWLAVHCG
jgi:cupin 2 domain-containing protein